MNCTQACEILRHNNEKTTYSFSKGTRTALCHSIAEVLHGNCETVKHFSVDLVIFQVDQIHLFTNLLQRSFGAKRGEISSHMT